MRPAELGEPQASRRPTVTAALHPAGVALTY